jgi:phage replication O-like protein O
MAIHESLLDDVSPSDSAVQRLRKRNRKIKPWESDLVLTSDPVATSEIEVTAKSAPSTPSVLGADSGLTTQSAVAAKAVVSTDLVTPPGEPSFSQVTGSTEAELIARAAPALAPDSGLDTESGLTTVSGLNTESVLRPISDPDTKLVSHQVVTTKTAVSPKTVPNSAQFESDENRRSTESSLDTDSVLSREPVLNPKTSHRTKFSNRAQAFAIQEKEGFTMVPHQITEALQREEFTARQLKILITILRETLGWGREFAVLSANDFKNKTGIATSHVFVTLRDLENIGAIIRKLNGKNEKNGYSLNRNFFSKYLPKRERNTKSELGTNLVSTAHSGVASGTEPVLPTEYHVGTIDSSSTRSDHSRSAALNKDLNIILKNSLSKDALQILLDFIEQVRPRSKKENEREFLDQLLTEYSPEEISDSLLHVQQYGVLGSAEPCHSPFRYLSTTIEQVLSYVKRKKQNKLAASDYQPPDDKGWTEEIERFETAEKAFKSTLTLEEQGAFVDEYIKSKSIGGFCPPRGIATKLAILEWHSENKVK